MKVGDLVRFTTEAATTFLGDGSKSSEYWLEWIGIVVQIENALFCKVCWHFGKVKKEFIVNLEVISESR